MKKDNSIVRSYRIPEELFQEANEIFLREGFSSSEVIRLLFTAAVREKRIPRCLGTKEDEETMDHAKEREDYLDSVLGMAGISSEAGGAEKRLLKLIFDEPETSNDMTNKELREWAKKWGFPESLSPGALAELYDSGEFVNDPRYGIYDADIEPIDLSKGDDVIDNSLMTTLFAMEFAENIKDNLEQVKRKMQARALKYLMEENNKKEQCEEEY